MRFSRLVFLIGGMVGISAMSLSAETPAGRALAFGFAVAALGLSIAAVAWAWFGHLTYPAVGAVAVTPEGLLVEVPELPPVSVPVTPVRRTYVLSKVVSRSRQDGKVMEKLECGHVSVGSVKRGRSARRRCYDC